MPKYVVHATDVGVGDLPREVNLPAKPFRCFGIVGKVQANKLDGNAFPKLEVLGFEDLAHAALPKPGDNPKPRGEEISGGIRRIQPVRIRRWIRVAGRFGTGIALSNRFSFHLKVSGGPRIKT